MRTHAANYVEVQTSEETSATGLTFTFASTGAFPAVPFYAALSRTSDTRREVVKFTTKTATTLQCASLGDRYLEGSVAESGIVHPAGTPVLVAPFGQHLSDLWDAIEAISASDATPQQVTAASQAGAAGTSANFARADHQHPSGAFEVGGAVAGHEGAADPHSQYVEEVGGSLRGYREPGSTLPTSGTVTLDFSTHNIWEINPTGAVTVAFAGLPAAGVHASGTLIVRNAGHAITWPVGTQHPGGTAPALQGKTYLSLVVEADGTVVVGRAWAGVA